MKKIFSITILILMLLSLVASGFALETEQEVNGGISDYENSIRIIQNEDSELGYDIYEEKSLFYEVIQNLFSESKDFTGATATDVEYICTLQNTYGNYKKEPFVNVGMGSKCNNDEYITFYAESGDLSGLIFYEAWHKTSSTDIVNANDHDYIADKDFTYSYSCYVCDATTNPIYNENTEVDITAIQISDSEITKDEWYNIQATLKITGLCDGCVVETGFEEYRESFSVIDVANQGACGDDKTVGYKFTQDGGYLTVRLFDYASTTGRFKIPVYVWNGCYDDLGAGTRILDSRVVELVVKELPKTLDCYQCNGLNSYRGVETTDSNCPEGYSETIPDCSDFGTGDDTSGDALNTCWYCLDNLVKSETTTSLTCPDGMFDERPSSCNSGDDNYILPGTTKCYYCVGGETRSTLINGDTCSPGTSIDPITCGDEDKQICYYCVGSELREEYATDGDCGEKSTTPLNCGSNDDLTICFSCENKQVKETVTDSNTCPDGTSINEPICDSGEVCGDGICDPNEWKTGSCPLDCDDPNTGDDCNDPFYSHTNPDECLDPNDNEWIYYVVVGIVVLFSVGLLIFINPKGKNKRK